MDAAVMVVILGMVVASVVGMRQAYRQGVADGYQKALRQKILWRAMEVNNGHKEKSG